MPATALIGEKQYAGPAQHVAQRDQWQSGECGRIAAVDSFEDGDAQSLILGAAGAIVWLLDAQIGIQFGIGQVAKRDKSLDIDQLCCARMVVAAIPEA